MYHKYSEEEKKAHLEKWRNSGLSMSEYSRVNHISRNAFSRWITVEKAGNGGVIEFSPAIDLGHINSDNLVTFENETIKIELKKNYNKDFLRKIVEVLVND